MNNESLMEPFLKSNIDYQFPAKFDCNVLDNTMSLVLQVRNVQEDSLKIQRNERSLHLKFTSIGAGYYPSHYSFYIQLNHNETEAKIVNADAEAWENNVVLNLHLNETTEQMLSYLAGLDSNNLQEYLIQEKFKVAHNSRQREKKEQPTLDISIERSECENSVEIEIKSRGTEISTCNANTTEEEEMSQQYGGDGLGQQNQKKTNKKQKRKNKKRRSLSESACDDIKAYQQQQQQQQQSFIPQPVPEVNETEDAEDADDDDEDSSPDRIEKSSHPASLSVNVPSLCNNSSGGLTINNQQRKHRSFSESRDSVISLSAGSSSYKGILKHYSRYEPRPSISDSCSSIDEFSSSCAYSTSVDGMTSVFNSLRFSQSFSDIPEENVVGLSESCKKTVRFSEVIKKQVFR